MTDYSSICEVCQQKFVVKDPSQTAVEEGRMSHYCSMVCRAKAQRCLAAASTSAQPFRIAVFNHKGGTGKTTTAVNLAHGLALAGHRVLLVDGDAQGHVAASLGVTAEKTLYDVLVRGADPNDVVVTARENLDVIVANRRLAAAEVCMSGQQNRYHILSQHLDATKLDYDTVVVDCAPALSVINENALTFAEAILIPVACDYLSMLGVKQVLETVDEVKSLLRHDVSLFGVLPTFYDTRNRCSGEAVDVLNERFGDGCLPAIRINTKLSEAPGLGQTIFEYAPNSKGTSDYAALVARVRSTRRKIATPVLNVERAANAA